MKTFPPFALLCCFLFLFFSFAPCASAGFASGTEPILDPDTPEAMLNDTDDVFSGIGFTYPMLPDEFYAGLQSKIAAAEAMGAAAFTMPSGSVIPEIGNYSPSLSDYTGEHQLIMSNLTHNFTNEAGTVGRSYTDSMAAAYQDINTRADSFYDPSSGFPASAGAQGAATRNLVLTYTDENEVSFDPQIAASHAAAQAALSNLNTALNGYAALNPADPAPANQAAVAAAKAQVEAAADTYALAYHAELAYRAEQSELAARGYRSDTENSFSGFASDLQNSVDNTPSSGMLINAVIGGLATDAAGSPYFNPGAPMDATEAYSRTPGARNVAAYDVARRIYDDLETGLQDVRRDAGDVAQAIGEGRTQYRLYDQSLDTTGLEDAVRRSTQDFTDSAAQRGQLFGQDIRGLAQQYGNGTIIDGDNFRNQADAVKTNFHLDQSAALGRAQNTYLDQLSIFEDAAKNAAVDFKTDLADRATQGLARAPEVRNYITDRMQAYDDSTHENVVNLVDDVVYESLVDLEAKISSGALTSFDFSSLNSPNLENGKFKHFFFDPPVAVGYEFEVLSGPNFRSVSLLPAGGDTLYDLYLFTNGAWNFERNLLAELDINGNPAEHLLNLISPDAGVPLFMIRGIAPEAMLDPGNPFAFTAGLTFTGILDNASIRMTPLTEDYTPGGGNPPSTVVPEPASLALLGAGLLGAFLRGRKTA